MDRPQSRGAKALDPVIDHDRPSGASPSVAGDTQQQIEINMRRTPTWVALALSAVAIWMIGLLWRVWLLQIMFLPLLLWMLVVVWSDASSSWRVYADNEAITMVDRRGRRRRLAYTEVLTVARVLQGNAFEVTMNSGRPRRLLLPRSPLVMAVLERIPAYRGRDGSRAGGETALLMPDGAISRVRATSDMVAQSRTLSPADPPDQLTEREDA